MKRLAVVALAAVAGFVAAIVHFTHVQSAQTCLGDFPTDSSYSAKFVGSVTMGETNHVLLVTHNGQPVHGYKVCLDTWMVGMSGMAMTSNATEQSSGHYQVPLQFEMSAPWQGNVVITTSSGSQIAVPITFNVGSGGVNMPGMSMSGG